MAEEHVIEWPPDRHGHRGPLVRNGRWTPMRVMLETITDAYDHRLYWRSGLPIRFWEDHHRPLEGVVVLDSNGIEELALIVRMPRGGVGVEYGCDRVRDYGYNGIINERLAEGRRWIGIRPAREHDTHTRPIQAVGSRVDAIRHAMKERREWERFLPEAQPEGLDLEVLLDEAVRHGG